MVVTWTSTAPAASGGAVATTSVFVLETIDPAVEPNATAVAVARASPAILPAAPPFPPGDGTQPPDRGRAGSRLPAERPPYGDDAIPGRRDADARVWMSRLRTHGVAGAHHEASEGARRRSERRRPDRHRHGRRVRDTADERDEHRCRGSPRRDGQPAHDAATLTRAHGRAPGLTARMRLARTS